MTIKTRLPGQIVSKVASISSKYKGYNIWSEKFTYKTGRIERTILVTYTNSRGQDIHKKFNTVQDAKDWIDHKFMRPARKKRSSIKTVRTRRK